MFEEAQLYSPVTTGEDGSVTVHLAHDHPGANDPAYRERRAQIAAAALAWRPGQPSPSIAYTDEEQEVWATVCRELAPKHERYAVVGVPGGEGADVAACRARFRISTRSATACGR